MLELIYLIFKKYIDRFALAILIILAIIFCFLYSYINVATTPVVGERIFNSPDENANYIFSRLFSANTSLFSSEPLNSVAGNIIYPRSVKINNGNLVPGSFLGIILIYGIFAKFFGHWLIVYLTPIFSIFGLICFYGLIKRIFGLRVAFISAILLLIFPAWWYYNARSMFHNVLFMNLLMAGFYFYYRLIENKEFQKDLHFSFLSSFFIGLALITRTSEIFWIMLALVIVAIIYRKLLQPRIVFIFLVTLFLIFIPIFYHQEIIYGHLLTSAYGYSADGASADAVSNGSTNFFDWFNKVLPFGFHPRRAIINFYHYYAQIFWWFFLPVAAGLILFAINFRNKKNNQKIYATLFLSMAAYLIIYYGSWQFYDNLDPKLVTLGTSYTRYWLPIYVFSLPFAAYSILFLARRLRRIAAKILLLTLLILIISYLSFMFTWSSTSESLISVKDRIKEYYVIRERVTKIVPQNAVIMTEKSDKIFFPTFKVISDPNNGKVQSWLPQLIKIAPVYYYTFLSDNDLTRLKNALGKFNLDINEVAPIFGQERLFTVVNKL